MMNRHQISRLAAPLLCLSLIGCGPANTADAPVRECDGSQAFPAVSAGEPLHIAGPTMGTRYNVKLVHLPAGVSLNKLQSGIDQTLRKINDRMSTWQADSELSRFNQSRKTGWFDVSAETALVVTEALRVSRLSGGTFDVTVNPLLRLWGFGPNGGHDGLPTDTEIAKVSQRVGYRKIHVRAAPPALRKDRGDMEIVLSAIAKGFAVDRVAEFLEGRSVTVYMVEIGGEVRARGEKSDGSGWTIGIEKPTPNQRSLQTGPFAKIIELSDLALATSGDYRNYFEKDGIRYSHTIDPRTGRPIEHRLASVTVVARNCMHADAMATALMVLGPEDGYNLAVGKELAAYLIVHGDDGFVEKTTPEFAELVQEQRKPQ